MSQKRVGTWRPRGSRRGSSFPLNAAEQPDWSADHAPPPNPCGTRPQRRAAQRQGVKPPPGCGCPHHPEETP